MSKEDVTRESLKDVELKALLYGLAQQLIADEPIDPDCIVSSSGYALRYYDEIVDDKEISIGEHPPDQDLDDTEQPETDNSYYITVLEDGTETAIVDLHKSKDMGLRDGSLEYVLGVMQKAYEKLPEKREKERQRKAAIEIRQLKQRQEARIAEPLALRSPQPFSGDSAELYRDLADDNELYGLAAKRGMLPYLTQEITDKLTMHWSKVAIIDGRPVVFGISEHDGNLKMNMFYKSLSQDSWRYTPRLDGSPDTGFIRSYHKNHSETENDIPIDMQEMLENMTLRDIELNAEKQDTFDINCDNRLLIRAANQSAVKSYTSGYVDPVEFFFSEVHIAQEATVLSLEPEAINFDEHPELEPDFSTLIKEWVSKSDLYGSVQKRVFASRDGSARYIICTDAQRRSWIGSSELINSPVRTSLIRNEAIHLGVAGGPANEYMQQAGSYAGEAIAGSSYVDVYEKFISRIPIIQRYNANFSR